MATYTVTFKQLIDNYAVLQTLTNTEIAVGQSITVASVAVPFNGTFTVYAQPEYLYIGIDTEGDLLFDSNVSIPNQVLYACTGTDVDRIATTTGTITYTQNCTWVATNADLITYLGVDITNPSDDYTLVGQARNAGNDFCYRRRQESGYFDSLTTSPGHDVTLGTLMYAAALWRGRGSVQDTFATFDGMGGGNVNAMTPVIKQLLGIDRPQVA
jgi:hypothetical protein